MSLKSQVTQSEKAYNVNSQHL